MKVNVLALLLLIFSIGCGEDVDTIDLEVISADGQYLHSWGGYHWNSNHLSPTVVDKTKSTLYNVTGMIAEWNGLNTPIQPVLTASKRGDITVSESSSTFWLGLAQIWLDSSGHIVKGEVNTCIVLPESLQIDGNQPKEVIFYIDPSRINLVWIIQESVGEKFNIKAQEISQDLSQNLLLILMLNLLSANHFQNHSLFFCCKAILEASQDFLQQLQSSLLRLQIAFQLVFLCLD